MISESDCFGSERESEKIAGAVNYPFGSERQRGYVFYQLLIKGNGLFAKALIDKGYKVIDSENV